MSCSKRMHSLTTGNLAPQMRIKEKDKINPILAVMFSYMLVSSRATKRRRTTDVGTSIEAFCTISGVKQEGLVFLNEGQLMSETLDLTS